MYLELQIDDAMNENVEKQVGKALKNKKGKPILKVYIIHVHS